MKNPVPPMVDPLSTAWKQPDANNFLFTQTFVYMSKGELSELKEYSLSTPSGAYSGKMWKRDVNGKLYLCWYSDSPKPGYVDISHLPILAF